MDQQLTESQFGKANPDNPAVSLVADRKSTQKQRPAATDQATEQNAQVTLGGAKTFVLGQIQKVEGDYYFVKDEETGSNVRLMVNKDTNMDCSALSTDTDSTRRDVISKRFSVEQQSPAATERQRQQGQKHDETAMGAGFRIGQCTFKQGDKIKAEVDDNGRVTLLKALGETKATESPLARPSGESTGTGELAIPGKQAMPGQLDMTISQGYPQKQYAILPVPLGEFKVSKEDRLLRRPVKDLDGKLLGSLDSLIMDSNTGKIEYAVVLLKETNDLQVVPWPYFSMRGKGKKGELVLNTKEFQLFPETTGKDAMDQSPEIKEIIRDVQQAKAPIDLRQESAQRQGGGEKPSETTTDVKGSIVRGSIQKISGDSFLVKDLFSGDDVRMRVDKQTKKATANIRDESFKEGDRVEAYVTRDGHAFSISLLRSQSGMPDDPEAGG